MREIETIHDLLVEAHGKGFKRKDLRAYEEEGTNARAKAEAGEFAKAFHLLAKATKGLEDWPEPLQVRARAARAAKVQAVTEAVDAAERLGAKDAAEGRRRLRSLRTKLRGTPLEQRVKALLRALANR